MASSLPAGRLLLVVVAATYLFSAALLLIARWQGAPVEMWVIVGWLLTGVAGVALAGQLRPGRPAVWVAAVVALGPWMVFSLVFDLRERVWAMAAVDVAGLVAIGFGLWMARAALHSS